MLKHVKGGKEGKKRRSGVPGASPLDQQADKAAAANAKRAEQNKSPVTVNRAGRIVSTLKSAKFNWKTGTAPCPHQGCGCLNAVPRPGTIQCFGCRREFYVFL